MLQVTPFEFFARGLPEGFLFIFAAYTFSKNYINIKRYILSSIIYVIIAYTIRFLPINYGVHTILNLFIFITLTVNINKINLVEAIRANLISVILLFTCEGINVLIIQYIFNNEDKDIFHNKYIFRYII